MGKYTVSELSLQDDLKTNFRHFETDSNNPYEANELFHIMRLRHPEEDEITLWDAVCDWTGYDQDNDVLEKKIMGLD